MKKIPILLKYYKIRPKIGDGDIILFHGTGIIANVIQSCDKSYYNHIGVIIEKFGTLYIVDSNADGVQADRLSRRILKYKNGGDFTIIKVINKSKIESSLTTLLKRSEDWIKYDLRNGIKELLNRKFNLSLPIYLNDKRDICSDFVSDYQIKIGMVTNEFKKLKIAFPQDTIRYLNKENTIILD